MQVPDSIDFFQVLRIQALTLELFAALDALVSKKVQDEQLEAEVGEADVESTRRASFRCNAASA